MTRYCVIEGLILFGLFLGILFLKVANQPLHNLPVRRSVSDTYLNGRQGLRFGIYGRVFVLLCRVHTTL